MSDTRLVDLKFPNGVRLFCLPSSQSEARFIYREIFEEEAYLQHGISIKDGDCIVDAGANVGMFSLFAMMKCSDLRIFSFEPTPPILEALRANVERFQSDYSGHVEIVPLGLSDQDSFREITYYPRAPGNSTLYGDEKQREPEITADAISVKDVWKYDKPGFLGLLLLYPFRRSLIRWGLRKLYSNGREYRCEFTTLSNIIEKHGIESIDLLKIDVEGSEFDILRGLDEKHWDRVQQLVIEIAPCNSAQIERLTEDLTKKGFQQINLQSMGHDSYLEGHALPCNLYAVRRVDAVRGKMEAIHSRRQESGKDPAVLLNSK